MMRAAVGAVLVCGMAVGCSSSSGNGGSGLTSPSVAPGATQASGAKGQGGTGSSSAVMQFGKADVGTNFAPDSGHDQSGHAKDDVVPRTVVIDAGGTVTFNLPANVHQIAIYADGTQPEDINLGVRTTLAAFAGCAGPPVVNAPLVINDPTNRVAAIPVPCFAPAQRSFTFTTPGKYLVICAFVPHFEVGMYGWVDVK